LIPLAQPVLGAREEELVLEVLRSGQLSLGPMLPRFEQGFAQRIGVAHASAVSSGTAGLHLGLRAVGVRDGDEVITSPFSFVATANAIVYERAKPVFVDIDPVTLNASADAMAAAVTDRTRALLPVHIFGWPAEIAAMEKLGLPIVEDAAEALGAVHPDGTRVGAHGHPAIFAFYANKQLATGEGGMVTMSDPAMKQRIDSERNQGRAPNMDWLDHDRLGFNYRLSDVACALGVAQLEHLDEMLAGRRRAAGMYAEALADLDVTLPLADGGGALRGWFVYVIQLPRGLDRDGVMRALAERGIQSKPYMPAIHLMSYYRKAFGHREGEFPVCEDVAARSLALPFFPRLTEGQVAEVAEALESVLATARSSA
jgi:perosamine synthetase